MTSGNGKQSGRRPSRRTPKAAEPAAAWDLRLYVAGETPRSRAAIENLRRICAEHFGAECRFEVIDLRVNPALARGDQIVAVPTLVRRLPEPLKRIIGDLSNVERVLVGLDLREPGEGRGTR